MARHIRLEGSLGIARVVRSLHSAERCATHNPSRTRSFVVAQWGTSDVLKERGDRQASILSPPERPSVRVSLQSLLHLDAGHALSRPERMLAPAARIVPVGQIKGLGGH